ncbi:MAG: hypothetical protein ACLPY5_04115 [Candidatus Bathyarchaeia archaeon]
MKTSQKIGLVSLAAATFAVVVAASREPEVRDAFKEAQINFGRVNTKNVRSLAKRLNEAAPVNHTGKSKN